MTIFSLIFEKVTTNNKSLFLKPLVEYSIEHLDLGGSSSRVILGAAQWRENKQKSKDPGFARRPGET